MPKFDAVGEGSTSATSTPLTLDIIKRNLDKGRYLRFDRYGDCWADIIPVTNRQRRWVLGYLSKAVYTIASVAYGWAGAVTEVKSPFGVFSHCVGTTDRVTSRVACT